MVSRAEFFGDGRKVMIGGPELQSAHNRGGKQMNVYPADAAPVQISRANKGDDIFVGNGVGLRYFAIGFEELLATASIADQQLPEYELVADRFLTFQQTAQLMSIRRVIAKRANPD